MKVDWMQLELDDEQAREETIRQCHVVYSQHVKRQEHTSWCIFLNYMKMEGFRIWKGYLIFLLLFMLILYTMHTSQTIMHAYYGAFGGYFIYQLVKYQGSGLDELMYTMPLNGARIFLFQMFSFLMLFLMTVWIPLMTGILTSDFNWNEVVWQIYLPLYTTQSILMLILNQIQSYQGALGIYAIFYAGFSIITNTITTQERYYVLMKMIEDDPNIIIVVAFFVSLIFWIAGYRYYKQLGKERFHAAKC